MLLSLFAASVLVPFVWAAPAGVYEKRLSDPPNVPTKNAPGPPGAEGSLRGPDSLAGYSSSNEVSMEPTTEIPHSEFGVAPGQSANPVSIKCKKA